MSCRRESECAQWSCFCTKAGPYSRLTESAAIGSHPTPTTMSTCHVHTLTSPRALALRYQRVSPEFSEMPSILRSEQRQSCSAPRHTLPSRDPCRHVTAACGCRDGINRGGCDFLHRALRRGKCTTYQLPAGQLLYGAAVWSCCMELARGGPALLTLRAHWGARSVGAVPVSPSHSLTEACARALARSQHGPELPKRFSDFLKVSRLSHATPCVTTH
jgi:hypothetical protein